LVGSERISWPAGRFLSAVAITTAALWLSVAPGFASAAGDGKRPGKPGSDLVVRSVAVDPPRFFFADEPDARVMVTVKVQNRGKARSRKSRGSLEFSADPAGGADGSVAVPFDLAELAPGKVRRKEVFMDVGRLPGLGRWDTEVCADRPGRVRERNERNNCTAGQQVLVIPRRWSGEVRGSAPVEPGITESWTARVVFDYVPSTEGFAYEISSGRIAFTTSGTDSAGCTHSGAGTYELEDGPGRLEFDPGLTSYSAVASFVRAQEAWPYAIAVDCGDRRRLYPGPNVSEWLRSGDRATSAAAGGLEGSAGEPDGRSWSWSLAPGAPVSSRRGASTHAADAGASLPGSAIGVVPQTSLDKGDFARIREAGIGIVRISLNPAAVFAPGGECRPVSELHGCNWAPVDAVVRGAATAGARVLPTLAGVAGLDPRAHEEPLRGETLRRWREFLRAAALRYGPGGTLWESEFDPGPTGAVPQPITEWLVGNEPNGGPRADSSTSPRRYARVLRISARALRSANPTANPEIILAGMYGRARVSQSRYLSRLYRVDGVRRHFDAVAVHPYAPKLGDLRRQVRSAHRAVRRAGDSGTDLWVTEIGWGSGSGGHPLEKGPQGQAEMLERSLELLGRHRERWSIAGAIWFTWQDRRDGLICRFCRHAGLFDAVERPKPAWETLRDLIEASGTPGTESRPSLRRPRRSH
jgi:hypothetical protein